MRQLYPRLFAEGVLVEEGPHVHGVDLKEPAIDGKEDVGIGSADIDALSSDLSWLPSSSAFDAGELRHPDR